MVDERLIADIRRFHRDRCFMMDTRKIVDLRLGAHLRRVLGWRKNLPEDERKSIAAKAARMMEEGGGPYARMIAASHEAREIFAETEEAARKEMAKLAKQLPVWKAFATDVRGFGEVSLAVIIAEAGDLSNYDSKSKLWKRMGLAAGQNRVPPNLSKEARAQAWIERGYSPRRRSHMFVIGESMVKAQVRQVKDADGKDTGQRIAIGPYGEAYLSRKAHTQKTHPEWWRDKDGNDKTDPETGRAISEHGNKDAQRYMEKRLLRDLWQAWRRATELMTARSRVGLPAAPIPGEGQPQHVQQDHEAAADARSPMPEGQNQTVREDHAALADGLLIPSGEGQLPAVRKDQTGRAFPVRDYKIPTSLAKAKIMMAESPIEPLPSP